MSFDSWSAELLDELENGPISPCVGSELVSENDRVRVWHLTLAPGERVGFHRHVLDYFWTVTAGGRSRSHYADGRIADTEYSEGDTSHYTFGSGEEMIHDLANIGNTVLSFVTVEHKNSANPPQVLPASLQC